MWQCKVFDSQAQLFSEVAQAAGGGIRKDYHELLAAKPCHDIGGTSHAGFDCLSDPLQNLITSQMTVGIIKVLEVVDIDHQDRASGSVSDGTLPFDVGKFVKVAAIVQSC